jgi:tetratricopeptide (TPR) repeat protein
LRILLTVAMQRRLNTKLLFCTLASLAVLLTAVYLFHGHQMHRNSGALMREAERAEQHEDFARAVVHLQHYLAYQPNDTEVIARYALALAKASSSCSARFKTFLLLEQVLRRQPERHDLRRHAIQAAIDLNRLADAVRHLQYLLKAKLHQGDLEHQLGWCQEALGQYEQSAASFRSAIQHAPQQVDSYILLAELLQRRLDQRDEAAKVMDAMVAANPKAWQAYLARARFHYGRGDLESAERDILQACALAPQQADVLIAGAEMAVLKGNLTAAREFVYRSLKLQPFNERMYRSLATLEMRALYPDKAIACLRLGLEKLPASAGLRIQLAEAYLDQQQPAEAGKILAWVQQNARSPGLVDYLQGRLLMLDLQWPEAIDKLLRARKRLGLASEWAGGICAALGHCYEQIGEPEQQLAALRTAVMQDSGNLATRLELGKAMLACKMPDDAAMELRNLTLLPNAPVETWVWLGKALIDRIKLQQGVKYPWKEVQDVLEQARWLYDHGRYGDADLVIRRLEKVIPLPAEIVRFGAEIALRNLDPGRALLLAQQAVPATARDYRDQLWLAQVQWVAGHAALAEETLRLAVKANSRIPDVWVALAHHLARTQKSDEVDKLLEEVLQKLPADRLNLTLARVSEAVGRHAKAEELYKIALAVPKRSLGTSQRSPGDLVAVRHLAEFYCRSDQFAKAEPYLQLLMEPQALAPGDLAAWASRQLALGLAASDFQQALKLLENNRSLVPKLNLGTSGTKVLGVEEERAYAFVLGSQSVHRLEAIRLIEVSLHKKPLSADEQFLLAQLFDSSGQHGKAGDQMRSLLAFHGDNAQYLAYHIRCLLQRGEISAARSCMTTLERLEPATLRTQQLQAALWKAQAAGK